MNYIYKNKNFSIIILIVPFLIGIGIYKDFGISIDEESTRYHGLVSLNYLIEFFNFNFETTTNIKKLESYEYREYGVFFEIIPAILEKVFNKNNYQEIFYFRHLYVHIIFLVSVIFFYNIIKNLFDNIYFALIGSAILYTTPRIFAHSFFNSKDIIFLSMFIISLYCLFRFFNKKFLLNTIFLGLSLALLTSVRSIGFYFFIIILLFMFAELLDKKVKLKNTAKLIIYLLIFYFLFLYLFWPFLWEKPIENFLYALNSFSDYNWGGQVFYFGKFYEANSLPWHYIPVWILGTLSIPFSILIVISVIFIIIRSTKRVVNSDKIKATTFFWNSKLEFFLLFNLLLIISPIILIILKNSTLYNGWRHLFFILPSMLILCLGLIHYTKIIVRKNKFLIICLNLLLIIIFLNNVTNLIKLHPYQNIYFNYFLERIAKKNFDVDYWGLSNKNALEKISFKSSTNVKVPVLGLANLEMSRKMLDKSERDKIIIVGENFEVADYIVSNSYFISDPRTTERYKKPESFILDEEITKGKIVINKIFKKAE